MQKLFFIVCLCLFVSVLSGCSTSRIPDQAEADGSIATTLWLEQRYGILNDPELLRMLARIVRRLSDSVHMAALETKLERTHAAQFQGFDWQVFVLNTSEVNAFCAGAGAIFVTRGLITRTQTEAELAAIVAHEMSHQLLGHPRQAIEESGLSKDRPEFSFSTEQEIQADLLGLQLLKVARYDLRYSVQALSLAYRPDGSGSVKNPKWLTNRMASLQEEVARNNRTQVPATITSREFNRIRKRLAQRG